MELKTPLNSGKTNFKNGWLNHINNYPISQREREEVEACRKFTNLYLVPASRYNNKISSYGMKHVVEEWLIACDQRGIKFEFENHHYVSNEAFKAAMVLEGYVGKPSWQGSPNMVYKFRYVGPKIFDLFEYIMPVTAENWEKCLDVNCIN